MRVLADIPDDDLQALAAIAARSGLSRAALVRKAVADLIARQAPAPNDDAFGVWGQGEDGLTVQHRLRAEW